MIENVVLQEKTQNGENTKTDENRVPIVTASINPADASDNFDTALWARISALEFDPPQLDQGGAKPTFAKLTFAIRLSRETGWTAAFADQAIQEYRRFLYLAVRAGHPVTPSQDVDEVWHLHLMHTRHYWGVLCRDVLQTDLHHGPSLGGASEHAKYYDFYHRTLDSYARIFCEPPPAEFWPTPTQRFKPKPQPNPRVGAVDPATHWIIRKPNWIGPNWIGPTWIEPTWPKLNLLRGLVLFCLTTLALAAPPITASSAASGGRQSENYGSAILLSVLGIYGLFKVVRFLTETPAQRKARKAQEAAQDAAGEAAGEAQRRQTSGSMSSGGCGGDSGSGCGGGCGGGCS